MRKEGKQDDDNQRKRKRWPRESQTDYETGAHAEAFEARDRFKATIERTVENKITTKLDEMKELITAHIMHDYDEQLWAHKSTWPYHKKMGFQPERILYAWKIIPLDGKEEEIRQGSVIRPPHLSLS